MDYEKLAYDLALQYSSSCLSDEYDSKEEKVEALLKSFRFAHDYLCEEFGVHDK